MNTIKIGVGRESEGVPSQAYLKGKAAESEEGGNMRTEHTGAVRIEAGRMFALPHTSQRVSTEALHLRPLGRPVETWMAAQKHLLSIQELQVVKFIWRHNPPQYPAIRKIL